MWDLSITGGFHKDNPERFDTLQQAHFRICKEIYQNLFKFYETKKVFEILNPRDRFCFGLMCHVHESFLKDRFEWTLEEVEY
jgi:hypothetical protein